MELEPFIGIQYINIYNVTKVSIISNILLRKKIFFFQIAECSSFLQGRRDEQDEVENVEDEQDEVENHF